MYTPSPTGKAFMRSKAFLKFVMGPVGGGKSTVALFDLIKRARDQEPFNNVRRTKFGILRNTMQQLKSTVKPLIDAWLITIPSALPGGGPFGSWRLTENTFEMKGKLPDGTELHCELIMLAADTPDDVRRLLSLELSAAWVEECREVNEEVFSGLQGRVARFPSRAAGGVTYPGVICSTNPPPLGTYWHEFATSPPHTAEIFIQPAAMLDDGSWNPLAENLEHLATDYYENLVAGKKEGWIDVYIRNKFGPGDFGLPVYRGTFKASFHVSKSPLHPISQSLNPLIIGCDNGLVAAATIGQRDARGRVNILAECYVPEGESMGFETFLDKLLIPLIRAKFPMFKLENMLFSMDPACFSRSSLDERTLAQAVQSRGFPVTKASTNDPERRIAAVEALLMRQIDGGAGLLIDPSCKYLISCFEWAYRFRKSVTGQSLPTPDKNHASNLSDSCQYLALAYETGTQSTFGQRKQAHDISKSAYRY